MRFVGQNITRDANCTIRFLVERIMSHNVFGCPISSLDTHKNTAANTSKKETSFGSCGIWIQASYINHSCVSNVRRSFIGDMLIVRASRDLDPNTELTFWYQSPDGISFEELQQKLKPWGFVCSCAMCNDARKTKPAVMAEREKLRAQLKQLCKTMQMRKSSTTKYERLLEALEATYTQPATDVPRLQLWDPQLLLLRMYSSTSDGSRTLEWVCKVLTTLGFVIIGADLSAIPFEVQRWGLMIDHLVEVFMHARTTFSAFGHFENSKRAEGYARVAYSIVVGESSSFESVYST